MYQQTTAAENRGRDEKTYRLKIVEISAQEFEQQIVD